MAEKRIFFGLEVIAPWQEELPDGRMLAESDRHITLAFIGNIDYSLVEAVMPSIPIPYRKVGVSGIFSECLFLPPRHSRCVSWNIDWITGGSDVLSYQHQLSSYLIDHQLLNDNVLKRQFLPHVTICRKPFVVREWKKNFRTLPMMATNLHLYESVGKLRYEPIWTHTLTPPFEEIDHTADIAFRISGEDISEIYLHACLALSFEYPQILRFVNQSDTYTSIDDIVIALNQLITKIDSDEGSPFKAVSFHGNIEVTRDNVLNWEMIVDV